MEGIDKLHCFISAKTVCFVDDHVLLLAFVRCHFNKCNIPSAEDLTKCVQQLVDELQTFGSFVWQSNEKRIFIPKHSISQRNAVMEEFWTNPSRYVTT